MALLDGSRCWAQVLRRIGAGPGGLFLGTIVKRLIPDATIEIFERNRAEDAFGFGVVFSDQTLTRIDAADSVLHDALAEHGVHWDPIEVRLKGQQLRFTGNGMAAINRRILLGLLQNRAAELGVDVQYSTVAPDIRQLAAEYDLVVAADGANSASREQFADTLHPAAETATAKFIWFGTTYMFDGLTFLHRKGEHGNFAVHGYPISSELSTFIVEADEATWRAAGLDEFDVSQPPGPSDLKTKDYLEQLFADDIDGHPLVVNNSRWGNFRTRRTPSWHSGNIAWLGDAVHTAHFSVGSGTKMAMEDAVSLATHLAATSTDVPAALAAYEAQRCLSCGTCFECDGCLGSCPEDAIVKLGTGHRYRFDFARCTGCGTCYEQCPVHAIEMVPEPTVKAESP